MRWGSSSHHHGDKLCVHRSVLSVTATGRGQIRRGEGGGNNRGMGYDSCWSNRGTSTESPLPVLCSSAGIKTEFVSPSLLADPLSRPPVFSSAACLRERRCLRVPPEGETRKNAACAREQEEGDKDKQRQNDATGTVDPPEDIRNSTIGDEQRQNWAFPPPAISTHTGCESISIGCGV